MKKNNIIISLLLLLSGLLSAQEVAISYEVVPQSQERATLQLYLQSMTDQEQLLGAINLSLALPAGCVQVTGQEAIFSDAWTDFLQEVQMSEGLDLNYNSWSYSRRWQYGSADPGMPNTTAIIAPAQGNSPLLFMEISLEGSCLERVYLEEQTENAVNQMGDADVRPIGWTVIHPRTELELDNGLKMDIFPNPVQDDLHVKMEGQRAVNFRFDLFTIDGKKLKTQEMDLSDDGELTLEMTGLPAAVYLLSVSEMGSEYSESKNLRIIKK